MPEQNSPNSGLLGPDGRPLSPQGDPSSPSSASTADDSRYARAESIAELTQQMTRVAEQNAELRAYIDGLTRAAASVAPVQTAPQGPPPITDDDINKAIQSIEDGGNPAQALRRLVDTAVNANTNRLEQQLRGLEQYGAQNFTHFAEAAIAPREYFKRFEREIRAEIDGVDPRLKGSPQAWDYAYNIVVGRHAHELTEEKVQEAVRQAREAGPANLPGTQTAPAKRADGTPIPRAADLGSEAQTALRVKKLDEETFARSIGYDSWSSMQQQMDTLKDPYEDDEFMFRGKGRNRGPSFKGNSFTRRAVQ